MIRFCYLSILLVVGMLWIWDLEAGAQDVSPADQVQANDQGVVPKNPFKQPTDEVGPPASEEDRILFKQLPDLRLKGILKFKDKDPVGLLEINYVKGKEIYRVRKGDKISITLPGEDVIRSSELKPPPPPPPAQNTGADANRNAQAPDQGNQAQQPGTPPGQGGNVGVRTTTSPKITLKEIQVVFEIMEIDRNGLSIEALPLKERILVR
ncbi:MAG: hypothetical protein KJ645_01540 [Planctomycetes bacterium]|nr:hypothetical protein [Planctomycetota bacterium]